MNVRPQSPHLGVSVVRPSPPVLLVLPVTAVLIGIAAWIVLPFPAAVLVGKFLRAGSGEDR